MYIGTDIGGTSMRVAAFRSRTDSTMLESVTVPISPMQEFERDSLQLKLACEYLQAQHGTIDGIGLAVAGRVNEQRTMLTNAPNLPHWNHQPVADHLKMDFICPVVFGNDAEASALAEAKFGHGQHEDFWALIWGTGIGGTIVRHIGGRPYAFAAEPGHQRASHNDIYLCGCGQMDCLEAVCGGNGIRKRFKKGAEELCDFEWQKVIHPMAIGLRNILAVQPVSLITFSGGITFKQSQLLPRLQEELKHHLKIVDMPTLRPSAFGESAGTIGSLALLDLLD